MGALLQISDTHFGTERPDVVAGLLDLVTTVDPEVVVMSGDITQRATARQFALAREFVQRLGPRPVLIIPGNHDVPLFNLAARAFWPYRHFRRYLGAQLEPHYRSDDWHIVCVNTTRPWRHVDGEVSPRQVARTVAAFRQVPGPPAQRRVVVVHQPVAVMREQDAPNLLHGREAALRAWQEAGVHLVLGGHIHLPYALRLDPHAGSPELEHPRHDLWVVQAGTAVSSRTRHEAGNSVNLFVPLPDTGPACRLERWDWSPHRGVFERACDQVLDPRRMP